MFSIHPDPSGAILRVILSGFMQADEVERFAREEQDAARTLTRSCGDFDLLIETQNGGPQGQDIMASFHGLIAKARYKARSIAIVADRPLLRMQLRRVLTLDHVAVFDSVDAARGWLESRRPADLSSVTP